jgi:protein TonB
LHIIVLALLLTPPVALQVIKQAEKEQHFRWIEPEKVQPEPQLPTPVRKQQAPPQVKHPDVIQPMVPRITDVQSDMAKPMPFSDAPPAADSKPAIPDSEPSAIAYDKQTRLPYPKESLINREQGTVILRVLVGTDGKVQAVEIEKTSGFFRLDKAAREAVRGWTFHPAIRGGAAASGWALVPVTFNLQNL